MEIVRTNMEKEIIEQNPIVSITDAPTMDVPVENKIPQHHPEPKPEPQIGDAVPVDEWKPGLKPPWVDEKKQKKPKGKMFLKITMLVYLLLVSLYVYLSGSAVSAFTSAKWPLYVALGLHLVMIIIYIISWRR